jgi:hypothetical protein
LVGDGNTDIVVIEDPVVGALDAGLSVPVPGGASDIGNFLDESKHTLSVDKVVAEVAGEAGTSAIKSIALI